MAQTKRKRRSTKHRGNAAGVVETRGRTGRAVEVPGKRGKPGEKYDLPPNWKSATNRAAIAAAVFGVALKLVFKQPLAQAAGLTAAVFLFYIPLGYYTDKVIYERRMKKKQGSK